jgi:DNA-binding MarR family transcriptional regulator
MEAPKIGLDRNAITKMMVTFYTLTRNAWTRKAKGKHRGLLSGCAEDVSRCSWYLVGKYDRLFPSLKGLAYLARCSPAAVSTALDQLEAIGFITRHRRLKRVMTPLGFKIVQNTNAYEILHPRPRLAEAVFGAKKPVDITDSKNLAASVSSFSFLEGKGRSGASRGRNGAALSAAKGVYEAEEAETARRLGAAPSGIR